MLPLKSFQNLNMTWNLILAYLAFAKIGKFISNNYYHFKDVFLTIAREWPNCIELYFYNFTITRATVENYHPWFLSSLHLATKHFKAQKLIVLILVIKIKRSKLKISKILLLRTFWLDIFRSAQYWLISLYMQSEVQVFQIPYLYSFVIYVHHVAVSVGWQQARLMLFDCIWFRLGKNYHYHHWLNLNRC